MRILVTGGAGFIGSAVIRHLIGDTGHQVLNLDKLTYAASPEALAAVERDPRYAFLKGDVCDAEAVAEAFRRADPDAVLHLAAETHVDRSIDGPAAFIRTNVVGTQVLLDAALAHWRRLPAARGRDFRFHHVSTDEVFGSLGPTGRFVETTRYEPNSPYSASKAGSDHLVHAWHATYGLPVLLTNCSNNYGPFQFPEKLIPLMVIKALRGEALPVYGRGDNVRDWLYVEDHAEALRLVLERGAIGESYNIGGHCELTNLAVVHQICALLDRLAPRPDGRPHESAVTFVTDRPGHDQRYAMDAGKIERMLGWRPRQSFASGIELTLRWYLANRAWWEGLRARRYAGDRLGLGAVAAPAR